MTASVCRQGMLPYCALLIFLGGCDWCMGGGEYGVPSTQSRIFALNLQSGGADPFLEDDVVFEKWPYHYDFRYQAPSDFEERRVSANAGVTQVLVGGDKYERGWERFYPSSSPLADSLDSCSFVPSTSTPLLCIVIASGPVSNSRMAVPLTIKVARSYIGLGSEYLQAVFLVRNARFVSAERYRIERPEQVVLSSDGKTLAALLRHETRQVVVDASGAVVNDFTYASSHRLVVLRLDNPEVVTQLSADLLAADSGPPEQPLPVTLTISNDGSYIAVEQDGVIRVSALSDSSQVSTFEGYLPQIVDGKLLTTPERGHASKLLLYDLADGSRIEISTVDAINSWLHHPQSGLVFYVTAMALWSYNPTNDSHELIFDLSEYLSDQGLREPDIDLKSSALFYVFALPGNSSRLGLFGYITTRYDTSGDC